MRPSPPLLLPLAPVLLVLSLSSCTGCFFQPSRALYYRAEDFGPKPREAKFKSADGTALVGAFFPSTAGPAKGTVVQFHGNAENMTSHFLFAHWLVKQGYNLLVFDYRGYGSSEGRPSVRGAIEDGAAALAYARGLQGTDPDRIVVLGQSLGAALAVGALVQDGGKGVVAVVLEGGFASFRAVAKDKLSSFWPTWPLQWPLSFLVSDRYAPARLLARMPAAPLLVINGDADPIVPLSQGRALFSAAKEPKEFWTVPGGGHLETFGRLGSIYRPKLLRFLDRALRP